MNKAMNARKDMRQLLVYAGLALVIAAALAVSLTTRKPASEDARFTEVVSEFIILSAAPDDRGIDFLSRERTQLANRTARLDHIEPAVLLAYASALNFTELDLRIQIVDPDQTGPFDHTGVIFNTPDQFTSGQAAGFHWARVTERAENRASGSSEPANCGQERRCRAWLVYWDEATWYYAPVGSAQLDAALSKGQPDLSEILQASEGQN